MIQLGLQGAVLGVLPSVNNLNPTTGNVMSVQPYKNSFGVTVNPSMHNNATNDQPVVSPSQDSQQQSSQYHFSSSSSSSSHHPYHQSHHQSSSSQQQHHHHPYNNPYNRHHQQQQQQHASSYNRSSFGPPPPPSHHSSFSMGNPSTHHHHHPHHPHHHHHHNPLSSSSTTATSSSTTTDRQQRRIYVGNIPKDCTESEISSFFISMLQSAFPSEFNDQTLDTSHIQSTSFNYEKSFVFIDFSSAKEATYAMALDGIKLRSIHMLKIRRPKDYRAPPSGEPSLFIDRSMMAANIPSLGHVISTNVLDTPNKLFVGGLPAQMTEDQVLKFLSSFGPLKAFNLVKDMNTGLSKGYAFCEYLNGTRDTDAAIQGMNGVDMHGKKLVVQRASVGAKSSAAGGTTGTTGLVYDGSSMSGGGEPQQQQLMMSDHQMMSTGGDHVSGGNVAQQQQQPPLQQQQSSAELSFILNLTNRIETVLAFTAQNCPVQLDPTRVLVLYNMLSENDLVNDQVYEEIYSDVRSECSNFGQIQSIVIPRNLDQQQQQEGTQTAAVMGRIYVEYKTIQEAQRAQQTLAGKKYQGRMVVTSYCSEEEYQQLKKK